MDRVTVAVCVCVSLFLVGTGPVAAGPEGPPEDDYVDGNCWDARTIDPTNTTLSGSIDYENDADTVRFDVQEGDTFAVRIVTGESAHAFTLTVHMLETEWTGRLKPGGNTHPWGEWDLGVVLNDSGMPGYARAFTVVDDTMCLTVHDDPPEDSAYPVAWSLHVVENEVPDWYSEEDPEPVPTPESTPATTNVTTATNVTGTNTLTGTTAKPAETGADTDGDGVPDTEDYAPRDTRVQAAGDVRVVTETPSSGALGPGFGPVEGLLAVAVLGLLARRR